MFVQGYLFQNSCRKIQLLIVVGNGKLFKCPIGNSKLNWYIFTLEQYAAIKNCILKEFLMAWGKSNGEKNLDAKLFKYFDPNFIKKYICWKMTGWKYFKMLKAVITLC